MATLRLSREAMIREAKAIRKATSYDDLIDVINIKAFLNSNKNLKD